MPRFGRDCEILARAQKCVNLEEWILVALRERQEHHESFSDTVNRYLTAALHLEGLDPPRLLRPRKLLRCEKI